MAHKRFVIESKEKRQEVYVNLKKQCGMPITNGNVYDSNHAIIVADISGRSLFGGIVAGSGPEINSAINRLGLERYIVGGSF